MTEVVLLTTTDCSFCEQAKEVLGRLAAEFKLDVSEVPLSTEQGRELAKTTGAPFPPVVLIDGLPFSYGRLSERKLRKALA